MELSGFSVCEDFASLACAAGLLDLHNDFEFVELRHGPREASVELVWARRAGSFISQHVPPGIKLHFSGVFLFLVSRRDPEMPPEEDGCTEMIGFCWNDLVAEMAGPAKATPEPECCHFFLLLHGGGGIKVGARAARLDLSPGAGDSPLRGAP